MDTIYLDFAKAFDSVPHKRLIAKLKSYGINGDVLSWIEDFLSNRRKRVNINRSKSDWKEVSSGVPQGSVLGPILFLLFVNDITDDIKSETLLFADDAKIFSTQHGKNSTATLQNDLHSLEHWADKWGMSFNIDKCKVLHVGNKNDNPVYYLTNSTGKKVPLEVTYNEKDLGVYVDPKMTFSMHVSIQVNKANKMLGMIRRTYEYLDKKSFRLLFTCLVRPHLEYCVSIWYPIFKKDSKQIENVLRRATRFLPGLKNHTYTERLMLLELPSMKYRRERGDMIQIYKMFNKSHEINHSLLNLNRNPYYTRGHNMRLVKEDARTLTRRHFIINRAVNNWNSLHQDIVSSPSLDAFKSRLDKFWVNKWHIHDD